MKMSKDTLEQIKHQIKRVKNAGGFYAELLKDIDVDSIKNPERL